MKGTPPSTPPRPLGLINVMVVPTDVYTDDNRCVCTLYERRRGAWDCAGFAVIPARDVADAWERLQVTRGEEL